MWVIDKIEELRLGALRYSLWLRDPVLKEPWRFESKSDAAAFVKVSYPGHEKMVRIRKEKRNG